MTKKPFILVVTAFAAALINSSAWAQTDSTSVENPGSASKRQFILAEITGFPLNHTLSGSWQPYRSVRIGFGRKIVNLVEVRACADYSWFDFDNSDAWSTYDYSRGKRRDIALYPAIVLFKCAEIALGCVYTTQDEVYHRVGFPDATNPPQKTTIDPAVKKFDVYFHFGVGGTIPIAGPVGISLGILFRTAAPNGIYTGCRAGLKYEI